MNRPIVKAATAKNPFVSRTAKAAAILRNALDLGCKDILAPFPDVARHVIYAELIWRLPPNWLRVITVLPIVPRHRVDVVTPAEAEAVVPVPTTPSGVLPLSL